MEYDFEPLYPEILCGQLLKINEYKSVFKSENQYNKLILQDTKFRKFEANFLSLMNAQNSIFYLFVPSKLMRLTADILPLLKSIHFFDYKESEKIGVEISGEKYFAWTFEKLNEKLYTRRGKLFLRNKSGMFKCDDETTFMDILSFPIDEELEYLMQII